MKSCQLAFIHIGKKCSRTLRRTKYCYVCNESPEKLLQTKYKPPPLPQRQTDRWNIIEIRLPPQHAHPHPSQKLYWQSKSCCLRILTIDARSGGVFDLSRYLHDAINWYRFVPCCCCCCWSRWNIWFTLHKVNLSLGGASESPLTQRWNQTSNCAEPLLKCTDISSGPCQHFCTLPIFSKSCIFYAAASHFPEHTTAF